MDCQQTNALQEIVTDQAERLGNVQEQVNRARRALLDHDLDRVRYWLQRIEDTSSSLVALSPSPR